jgi:hypothetical protein
VTIGAEQLSYIFNTPSGQILDDLSSIQENWKKGNSDWANIEGPIQLSVLEAQKSGLTPGTIVSSHELLKVTGGILTTCLLLISLLVRVDIGSLIPEP